MSTITGTDGNMHLLGTRRDLTYEFDLNVCITLVFFQILCRISSSRFVLESNRKRDMHED